MTLRIPTKLIVGVFLLVAFGLGAFAMAFLEDKVSSEKTDTSSIRADLDVVQTRLTAVEARPDAAGLTSKVNSLESGQASSASRSDLCRVAVTVDSGLIAMLATQGRFDGDAEAAKTFLRGAGLLSSEELNC